MIVVIRFRITLTDGTNTIIFETPRVEWLPGGDSKVRFTTLVTAENGTILDNWEANQTAVSVTIEPTRCGERDEAGQITSAECTQEVIDYNSQDGTATVAWNYNPNGPSEVYISFTSTDESSSSASDATS